MLSKDVRDALEAERENLKTLKRQAVESFDTQIKAIDALLNPVEHFGPKQAPLPLGNPKNGAGPLAGVGLREAMRTVMTAYPAGLRPVEISQKLTQAGYQVTGTLPVNTRVWSELVRLRKREKRVQKRGRRYVWVGKNNTNVESQHEERLPGNVSDE